MLFSAYFGDRDVLKIVTTPVSFPIQQLASADVIKMDNIENACLGIFLRAGLRPAIILGDLIQRGTQETPKYALFKVSRSHDYKSELKYVLNEEQSHYDKSALDGRHLIVPDLMLATGGSLIAVDRMLKREGIKVKHFTLMSLISAVEGIYNVLNNTEARIATLAIDTVLNDKGYIIPGLGDAGDRLAGPDRNTTLDDMFKSFGKEFCNRYEDQVNEVYKTAGQTAPRELF